MSGTGKRNSDDVNIVGLASSIGVGAAAVALSMVLLAGYFKSYMADRHAQLDFVGKNNTLLSLRAAQRQTIETAQTVGDKRIIPITRAMQLVADEAKQSARHLVPAAATSTSPTAAAVYGRPQPLPPPPPPVASPAAPAPAKPRSNAR